MANEKHLLVTAQGSYVDTALDAEGWQIGLRLCLNYGVIDPVGTLPNSWDVVANTVNRTESDCTITGNWAVHQGTYSNFHPDDYLFDQVKPAMEALIGAFPGLSSQARLDTIKCYAIGTNGRAIAPPPYATGTPMLLSYTSGNPVGSSTAQQLPLQIAAVSSHRTPQTGRRGRGRMFLPAITTAAVNHDSLFASAWQSTAANVMKNTMEAMAYDGPGGFGWRTRPIVTGSPWTSYGVITSVRIGSVPDTQRRRRRALPETYVTEVPTYM